jgi:hypothetical protein
VPAGEACVGAALAVEAIGVGVVAPAEGTLAVVGSALDGGGGVIVDDASRWGAAVKPLISTFP